MNSIWLGISHLKKHPNYVDPRDFELEEEWEIQQEAQKKKKLEHKIRFYGMYLNYVGEDILELADFVEPSTDKAAVLKFGMKQVKKESGVLFKKKR